MKRHKQAVRPFDLRRSRFLRCLAGGALITASCGVAKVRTIGMRTDRSVVRSNDVVLRSEGAVVAQDVHWSGDQLTAQVKRERLCRAAVRDLVSNQDMELHQTTGVQTDVTTGVTFFVLGVLALVVSPQLSSEDDPATEEVENKQADAVIVGAAFSVTGLALFVHGLQVRSDGQPKKRGQPRLQNVDRDVGAAKVCGYDAAPPGRIDLAFGRNILVSLPFDGETVALDLRALGAKLCDSRGHFGVPLAISYAPDDRSRNLRGPKPASLAIASWNADACIQSRAALHLLDDAATRLLDDDPTTADVLAARTSLADAKEAIAALPGDDVDRAAHEARLAELEATAAMSAARLLEGAVRKFTATLEQKGPAAAIGLAAETVTLASILAGSERQVWDTVYKRFVAALPARAGVALELLWRLLRQDGITLACLAARPYGASGAPSAPKCPTWLDRTAIVETLAPLTTVLENDVEAATRRLEGSITRLEKKTTEEAYAEYRTSDAAAADSIKLCAGYGQWDDAVLAACGTLEAQRSRGGQVAAASAETLRRARVARTVKAWRKKFPTCRKVATTIAQLQQVSHCDSECQRILERLRRDWEELRNFSVPDGELDAESRATLHAECQEAQCPTCP